MAILTPQGIQWNDPVESDPQWVKLMTCALHGHQWETPVRGFALKVCTQCDTQFYGVD